MHSISHVPARMHERRPFVTGACICNIIDSSYALTSHVQSESYYEKRAFPRLLSLPRLAAPLTVASVVPPLAIWPLCEDAGHF